MTSPNTTRRAVTGAGAALTAAAFAVGLTAAPVQAQESLDVQAWAEPADTSDFYVGWTEETATQQARLLVETRGDSGDEHLANVHIEFGLSDQIQGITLRPRTRRASPTARPSTATSSTSTPTRTSRSHSMCTSVPASTPTSRPTGW